MQRMESKELGKPISFLVRLLIWIVSLLGYAGALCVANRPRFWWQELFCSLAAYWIPTAALFGALLLYFRPRCSRITQFTVLGALAGYGYLITFMGAKAIPYLYYQHESAPYASSKSELRAVWIDGWSEQDSVTELSVVLESKNPSVVIISGNRRTVSDASESLGRFAHHANTFSSSEEAVLVASNLRFGSSVIRGLGIEALPGGAFPLQLEDGRLVELGVMLLLPSANQGDFERNRITSRRLSSLIRNSDLPRIVVARFNTTPFSQLMSIYPEQARVSSLMYGQGLYALYGATTGIDISRGTDVCISRDFVQLDYEKLQGLSGGKSGVFIRLQLLPASRDLGSVLAD